jgi:hypothetical protein
MSEDVEGRSAGVLCERPHYAVQWIRVNVETSVGAGTASVFRGVIREFSDYIQKACLLDLLKDPDLRGQLSFSLRLHNIDVEQPCPGVMFIPPGVTPKFRSGWLLDMLQCVKSM